MDKGGKVRLIGGILLGGMGLSLLYHFLLVAVFHLHGYPYSTFLLWPEDRFNDFFVIFNAAATAHPYLFEGNVYFPFTYLLMAGLTLLPPPAAFCGLIGLFTAGILVQVRAALVSLARPEGWFWTAVILLSYPYLFVVDRGNVEIFVFLALALFLGAYAREHHYMGGLWLAMATAMKGYPGVFYLLFLKKRKWGALAASLALVVVLNLAGAVLATGGLGETATGLARRLKDFDQGYIGQVRGIQHGASLFGVLELGLRPLVSRSDPGAAAPWIRLFRAGYPALALCLFGLVAWFILRRNAPLWKQVLILVVCMILLPQVSFDYKLVHLYFPLLLFLRCDLRSPRDAFHAALFGLLLIPKDYGLLMEDVSSAVVLNPLLLLLLVGSAMGEGRAPGVSADGMMIPGEGA